jgi:hypothetical protein
LDDVAVVLRGLQSGEMEESQVSMMLSRALGEGSEAIVVALVDDLAIGSSGQSKVTWDEAIAKAADEWSNLQARQAYMARQAQLLR